MNASEKAAELRAMFVVRMETENDKYELPEYRQALEFTARLHREGLVHPEVIENNGADAKQLLNFGRVIATQDGMGAWRDKLFVFLSKNARRATNFFQIPPDRVVEIGIQLEL